jgi:hypothetical protein
MPTHALGRGTHNVPVNLIHEERSVLVKIAIQTDRSISAVVRAFILEGIRATDPETFRHLKDLRHERHERLLQH